MDLIEPRLVTSSSLNYISVARDRLFHLESLNVKGLVHAYIHMDEMKLRPVKWVVLSFAFFCHL